MAGEGTLVNGEAPPPDFGAAPPPLKRRASQRKPSKAIQGSMNPDVNANVLDGPQALRASPDADGEQMNVAEAGMDAQKQIKEEDPPPAGLAPIDEKEPKSKKALKSKAKKGAAKDIKTEAVDETPPVKPSKSAIPAKEPQFLDPEAEGDEEADEAEIKEALSRPPPVNSDYLPLPWKGRLGYVSNCLLDMNLC